MRVRKSSDFSMTVSLTRSSSATELLLSRRPDRRGPGRGLGYGVGSISVPIVPVETGHFPQRHECRPRKSLIVAEVLFRGKYQNFPRKIALMTSFLDEHDVHDF